MYIDEFWGGVIIIEIVVLFVKVNNLRKDLKKIEKSISGKVSPETLSVQEEIDEKPRYVLNQEESEFKKEIKIEDSYKNEFNFGSKWLTIIGVVSVIFGVGFFLKYAFDNNLISESGRVILGFVSGILLVILGDYFKDKLENYSHYLIGGGFAIVMLSAYYGIEYNLYSNAVGFILMILTTLMAGFLAHKLNSKILAGTTILAGFLSPILASSHVANEIVLFNYILILVAGMFWLVYKHGWNLLISGSLIGTVILYSGSMVEYYGNEVFWIYWIYLIIFFVVFAAVPVYSYFADKEDGLKADFKSLIVSAISGATFMLLSYMFFKQMVGEEIFFGSWNKEPLLNESFKNLYWVIGLIPALVYLWLSKVSLEKIKNNSDKVLLYFVLGMATLSIAMIPALQFTGKWITFAWLVEAVILGLIYYKDSIKVFLNLALISLTAGIFRVLFIDSNIREREWVEGLNHYVATYTPVFNERTLIYFVAIVSIFSLAYFAFKNSERAIAKWVGIIGNLLILFWIFLELDSASSASYISSDSASLLLSVFYLIYGGILIWIGIIKQYVGFRYFGLGLIGFVVLKTYFVDIWDFSDLIRISAFIILGVFILILGFYYSKITVNLKEFLKNGQ